MPEVEKEVVILVAPKSKWISVLNKPTLIKTRLICFPYAGGSAQSFKDWASHLPAHTQLCAIQLPGRSSRFTEPLFTSIQSIVEALRHEIKPFLDKPFFFFGHSMGAAISFELTRVLQKEGFQPRRLFPSGRNAPHRPNEREQIHQLPEAQFRDKLREMNGTPPEILAHQELMDLMAPIVRADFTVSESYSFQPGDKLKCPMTAFGGTKDPDVPADSIEAWTEHTTGESSWHMFPGDHFFLNSHRDALLEKIVHYLNKG